MIYKYTYNITSETELTEIDYSGVSYSVKEQTEELIYIKDLEGSIKIYNNDFDTFYTAFLSGSIIIEGLFYVDNVSIFNKIYYQLDAESFDVESKVVECKIVAEDQYYDIKDKYSQKVNVFEFDLIRSVLTVNKVRSKLFFYNTEVTGSSAWDQGWFTETIYAREEIQNAGDNEKNSLVGINGWLLDVNDVVRDWTYNFNIFNPVTDYIDFNVGSISTVYNLGDQGNITGSAPTYTFNTSSLNIDEYTYQSTFETGGNYFVSLINNDAYYGTENDFKYITVKNGIGLRNTLRELNKHLDSTINSVIFDYPTLFDFAVGEAIILQSINEITNALTRTVTITGNQIEPATKGYLTLEKINRFLRTYWNVYYYRSGNTIIYKHFSELFSYSTDNDLTMSGLGNLTPIQVISYNSNERFKRIERQLTADNIDFIGLDAEFANVKNNTVKSVNNQNFYCDINDAIGNDTGKYSKTDVEGWVVAHRANNSTIVSGEQILSDRYDTFINEKMSLAYSDANLLVGSDKTATVNGASKTLTSSYIFNYATLITFQILPNMVFDIDERAYFKTDYSTTHRLKELKLKLDGSAAELSLYY